MIIPQIGESARRILGHSVRINEVLQHEREDLQRGTTDYWLVRLSGGRSVAWIQHNGDTEWQEVDRA